MSTPITYRENRLTWFVYLLCWSILPGLFVIYEYYHKSLTPTDGMLWFFYFFILLAVYSIVRPIKKFRVGEDGLTVTYLGRDRHVAWSDVELIDFHTFIFLRQGFYIDFKNEKQQLTTHLCLKLKDGKQLNIRKPLMDGKQSILNLSDKRISFTKLVSEKSGVKITLHKTHNSTISKIVRFVFSILLTLLVLKVYGVLGSYITIWHQS